MQQDSLIVRFFTTGMYKGAGKFPDTTLTQEFSILARRWTEGAPPQTTDVKGPNVY